MKINIEKDKPFQIGLDSFVLSPSSEEYVLHYSADGVHYTAWEEPTPALETLIVNGIPQGMYFKLVGNNSILTLQG